MSNATVSAREEPVVAALAPERDDDEAAPRPLARSSSRTAAWIAAAILIGALAAVAIWRLRTPPTALAPATSAPDVAPSATPAPTPAPVPAIRYPVDRVDPAASAASGSSPSLTDSDAPLLGPP